MNINEGVYIFVSETILQFNAADAASDSATHRLTTATSCSHQQRGASARELCRVSIPRSPVLVIVTTQQWRAVGAEASFPHPPEKRELMPQKEIMAI